MLRLEEEDTWYASLVCRLQLQQAVSSGWELLSANNYGGAPCFHEVGSCGCSINCSASGSPSCGGAVRVRTSSSIDRLLPRYYDAALSRLVANWARRDFELFGYNSRVTLPPSLLNSTTTSTPLRPLTTSPRKVASLDTSWMIPPRLTHTRTLTLAALLAFLFLAVRMQRGGQQAATDGCTDRAALTRTPYRRGRVGRDALFFGPLYPD